MMYVTIFFSGNDATDTNIYRFDNIVDVDLSFYDNVFSSRLGYPDFSLILAFNPNPTIDSNAPVDVFSRWWLDIDKRDRLPKMWVRIHAQNHNTIAGGEIYDWVEDTENFEVSLTIVHNIHETLEIPRSLNQFTRTSNTIDASHSHWSIFVAANFFVWNFLNEWWNTQIRIGPRFKAPENQLWHLVVGIITSGIVDKIYSAASGQYRIRLSFNALSNIPIKDLITEISILTRTKLTLADRNSDLEFMIFSPLYDITGFITSINNNSYSSEIEDDKLIRFVYLYRQIPASIDPPLPARWDLDTNFTDTIKSQRNNYLENKLKPRTEYHIWGHIQTDSQHANTTLQSGNRIRLDSKSYIIREIAYESESLPTLKSFNAVCEIVT
jgi:uncharacterized protein YegP (UPF0339 family)